MWEVEVEIEPLGEISLLKSKLLVTRNFSLEHRGPQSILRLIGCRTLPVPLTFESQREESRAFDYGCKPQVGGSVYMDFIPQVFRSVVACLHFASSAWVAVTGCA
mgnify:CR=1 FL=1